MRLRNMIQGWCITNMLGGFSVILLALHTYGNFPYFLFFTERTSIPPRYFTYLLVTTSLLFLFLKWRENRKIIIWRPALIWFVSACLLVFVYYFLGKIGYLYLVDAYATKFLHGLTIMSCVVILLNVGGEPLFSLLCWVIKILFLLACLTIIYDYYLPGSFVHVGSKLSNVGRGAGYYINASNAGTAIICGWIFIILLYKSNAKYFYTLTTVGIYALLSTLTRSAWLTGFFSLCMALAFSVVKPRLFINVVILTMLCVILFKLLFYFTVVHSQTNAGMTSHITTEKNRQITTEKNRQIHRIDFTTKKNILNHSVLKRIETMKAGMEMITRSPIWGNGIGSVQHVLGKSPHNSFIGLWADFGILGLLLNLSLLFIIFYRFYRKVENIADFCFFTGCIAFALGLFADVLISNSPLLLLIAISFSNFSFGFVRR